MLEWVVIFYPGVLSDPGIKLKSPGPLAFAGIFFTDDSPGKPI